MYLAVLADDEPNQLELISYHLQKEGFTTLTALNGEDAFELIQENKPDIIIIDWMMPGLSGISLTRKIRSNKDIKNIPIIILSARGEDIDTSHGLNAGADDYMAKPFSPLELMARVRSLIRRSRNIKSESELSYGGININHNTKEVTVGGSLIKIGKIEYKILSILLSRPKYVFSREQLIESVWDNNSLIEDRTVDVHVSRLRRSIKKINSNHKLIKTIHGFGYSITDEIN
ncbi:MAG: two-component system phosphate regulon response regulator PhoB [Alphaproteobacteria bacterium]|jgi:two-component system phosphate regulon response regulator PhoB|tara:strand:+ start:12372 stop:13064 length:693 start_codon:yes stop_codon:yes gene_type:complete